MSPHADRPRRRTSAAIKEESGRRWQRLPLFLHLRALKP